LRPVYNWVSPCFGRGFVATRCRRELPRFAAMQGGGRTAVMQPTEPGLSHYLHVLRRGLWIVVLTVAIVTGVAVYASIRQTKLFRASADVFLGTQSLASTVSNVPVPSTDPVRAAATQADLARTPTVADQALKLAHLTDRSAVALLSQSTVTAAANADILTFTVTDPRPRVTERLAETYATAYAHYRRQLDTAAIQQARKDVERRLAQLQSLGGQNSAAYANLFEKDQELSTLQLLQGSNTLLVRSATAAVQIQPRPLRNGALGAMLGLVLGIGLVFLRDALNTRVRTAAEVQERLDMPLLGRLPEPSRRLRARNQLVMLAEPRNAAAEAFRIVATNLELVNLEPSARTIMFTSATGDEGKSTTVANLAIALARAGRRVALVDIDLRRPALAGLFSLDDHVGLTTVALGRAPLEDVLAPVSLSFIDPKADVDRLAITTTQGVLEVLPVGPPPPNPAEFVGSNALAAILSELEQRADLVLLDAPPILDLSDAMTLSSRVDGLVVVTKLSAIRRPTLQELHRVLAGAPITKLGFVLTGASATATYGAGGYGYGHSSDMRTRSETTA
jgi:polysaccharide biosynthesis transport protein